MSGLSVLKVLATVVDLFKMFNSTIGTFHHTTVHALQRSSLAGLRLLSTSRRDTTLLPGIVAIRATDLDKLLGKPDT